MESELKEIFDDEEKAEKLSRVLDKEVERRVEEKINGQRRKKKVKQTEEFSRRSFLKKVGAGAAGIGAMGLASASGLKLTESGVSGISGFNISDSGSDYFRVKDGGPVEVLNAGLRIPTGKSIQDGGGGDRLNILSNGTFLYDESGQTKFGTQDGSYTRIYADSSQPFYIRDQEGGFDAVEYSTSSSKPGTFKLSNSVLKTGKAALGSFQTDIVQDSDGGQTRMEQFEDTVSQTDVEIASGFEGSFVVVSGRSNDGGGGIHLRT